MTDSSYDEEGAAQVLKTDVLGRVKTSKAQRDRLLQEFENSGLSGPKFAAMAGVNYQTFACWMQKRRRSTGAYPKVQSLKNPGLVKRPKTPTTAPALQWLEAVVDAGSATAPAVVDAPRAISLIVRLPGGGSLELSDVTQVPVAVQLLQALRMSC